MYRARSRYGNGCEDTTGFHHGGDSAPITINLNGDHAQGSWSVQVNVGEGGYGNFGFADKNIEFSSNTYRYVHLWVKPLTAGSWLSFHCWDVGQSAWRDMNGDRDGDKLFEAGEDLAAGQWNEVWIDLKLNVQGLTGGTVRQFHMHSSGNSQFLVDGIYTVTQPWQTFYYHCDYPSTEAQQWCKAAQGRSRFTPPDDRRFRQRGPSTTLGTSTGSRTTTPSAPTTVAPLPATPTSSPGMCRTKPPGSITPRPDILLRRMDGGHNRNRC